MKTYDRLCGVDVDAGLISNLLKWSNLSLVHRIVCIVWLSVCAMATAAHAGDAYFRVTRLNVLGTKAVSAKEFVGTLSSAVPDRYKFWVPKPILSEEDLLDDVEKVRKFYQAAGYYDVSVTYRIEKIRDIPYAASARKPVDTPQSTGMTPIPTFDAGVVISVTEGARTHVHSIEMQIDGESGGIEAETLRRKLPLTVGSPFELEKYRDAKTLIEKEFQNNGYPFPKVTGNVEVDMRSSLAQIRFEIVPGAKCRFGEVSVFQKEPGVNETLLRRALTFQPGDIYEAGKIEESQRNLHGLDVFKSALLKPQTVLPDTGTVPIHLETKPGKRQSVKFGVGYGTEDGFRVKGGWTYRNVGGLAGRFGLNAKRSDIYEGIWADYNQPYPWDAANRLVASAGGERETLDSYVNQKVFGSVNFTRKLPYHMNFIFGYNLEINRLEDVRVSSPSELQAYERDHEYWISSLACGINQNTTDNEISPTTGHIVSLSMETASGLFGSSLSYLKPDLDLRLYRSIPLDVVLAGRIRIQSLKEIEDTDYIPIFKRLFLGGAGTVRGYGYQKLGLLDEAGKPLGGLSSLNANVELRRPVYESFSGVVFLDGGLIDEKSFHYDLGEMRFSAGIGFRYDTPVGPVRVDWGYKLNPDEREDDRWRIHFSVGQTF